MPTIFHSFTINAPLEAMYDGITTPKGIDAWWTKTSMGNPIIDTNYILDFGPGYEWEAVVTKAIPNTEFELQITKADAEWTGTKVGFSLAHNNKYALVSFYHSGWANESGNFKYSSYCWAMYLRILKRHLEFGETVPYELRLKV